MASLYALAHGDSVAGQPWLVWLHGFLGSHREWLPLAQSLPFAAHLLVDLPGHGNSAACSARDFADVSQQLRATLAHHQVDNYWLIGYSLGGRVAMYHACYASCQGMRGLIVEGAHPGIADSHERHARYQHDSQWARRLREQPLAQVLDDWYRQPVFASLTPPQRAALAALRRRNDPQALAQMLLATSLARQPDLRQPLSRLAIPAHYLCGERDDKFRKLAQSLAVPCSIISHAGHNAHRENPQQVAQQLTSVLQTYFKDSA